MKKDKNNFSDEDDDNDAISFKDLKMVQADEEGD